RRMKRAALIVVALALAAGAWWLVSWWSTRPIALDTLTAGQWREDLRHLARELPRRHKNAFHRVSREQFERTVADVDAAIPGLPPADVPVLMLKVTAEVGDAHTYVRLPPGPRLYPVRFYWFGDD